MAQVMTRGYSKIEIYCTKGNRKFATKYQNNKLFSTKQNYWYAVHRLKGGWQYIYCLRYSQTLFERIKSYNINYYNINGQFILAKHIFIIRNNNFGVTQKNYLGINSSNSACFTNKSKWLKEEYSYYGVLQPFSDALKLILKETVIPSHSNKFLFYLAPVSTLVFSLLGWGIIPFGQGLAISDFSLGILYTLALSSLGVYGVLLAGWSANSKYAFLGSLRSTSAMISYELILSSAILIIILLTGSLNFSAIIESQQSIWFIVPLLPVFIFYFIAILAETSRTPFDLQEAKN